MDICSTYANNHCGNYCFLTIALTNNIEYFIDQPIFLGDSNLYYLQK